MNTISDIRGWSSSGILRLFAGRTDQWAVHSSLMCCLMSLEGMQIVGSPCHDFDS